MERKIVFATGNSGKNRGKALQLMKNKLQEQGIVSRKDECDG